MAITRVKTSSILQNFPKERSMLAGNDGDTGAYESIATVSVGAGGQASAEFTNIPSTFQHLQIRAMLKSTGTSNGVNALIRANSDSGSNYSFHQLFGLGSSAGSSAATSQTSFLSAQAMGTTSTNSFAVIVVDILDYKDTNKYSTFRALSGWDSNGDGVVLLRSSVWLNTNAITTLTVTIDGFNLGQYSHVALYGIR